MARPSGYKPEYATQAEKLCRLGATDPDIADFFGVDVRTIHRWKHSYDEFCAALKRGKEVADEMVENSLFRRATGYSHDAVKIMQHDGAVIETPYTEHYPPDTTACIFWLKNRRPDLWRDRREIESTVTVTDERKALRDKIAADLAAPEPGSGAQLVSPATDTRH